MLRVEFIGLGIMGKPVASHLTKAGDNFYMHSRTDEIREGLSDKKSPDQ
jgi:3-hydroxyisobutyrate dehydrogenase-like beta-hydroxyacid dehydrogenase